MKKTLTSIISFIILTLLCTKVQATSNIKANLESQVSELKGGKKL